VTEDFVVTIPEGIELDAAAPLLCAGITTYSPLRHWGVFSLILGRRSFAGSAIGGIRETQEMLDFCAEHRLGAEIEVIPANKTNDAYERVLASDVRYRFVIDTSTLD
jgi:D-arabinose 1-dehydrogenase-like Zn-dependent alcohol dehydrogenase